LGVFGGTNLFCHQRISDHPHLVKRAECDRDYQPGAFLFQEGTPNLNAICISQILLYVVRVPDSALGWVLNTRVLRHLGVISYGLYLWQHMFTRPNSERFVPWNVLAILICAELSHWLIERPSFGLRDQLEQAAPWKRTIVAEPLNG
jgi:peptidoglycan/LPS O-acetylase OafA/YrhL